MLAAGLGLWGLCGVGALLGRYEFRTLSADTASLADLPPYAGALSTLGLFLWATSAAVCLFAAALVWRLARSADTLLVSAALLSLLMLGDDWLLLHENVVPRLFGLPEQALVLAEGLLAGWFVWAHAARLRAVAVPLTRAAVLFAASLTADQLHALFPSRDVQYFVEDGAKFGGLLAWSVALFGTASATTLAPCRRAARPEPCPPPLRP